MYYIATDQYTHTDGRPWYDLMNEKSTIAATMSNCRAFLDQSLELIQHGKVSDGMEFLINSLWAYRNLHDDTHWHYFVKEEIIPHKIREVLHEDPFTRRAFEKPRGYAGDAVLIDYIYNAFPTPPVIDNEIEAFTTTQLAARAVNNRCGIISKMIDRHADESNGLRVLSIAAGHLREASRSKAIAGSGVEEIVAMDMDPQSLEVIRTEYSHLSNVVTRLGNVRDIILEKYSDLREFDFIYASGLYDYLDNRVASRLTAKCFSMLKPGGKLIIPNFVPGIRDVGYMESYMDWSLVYRNRSDMVRLASSLPINDILTLSTFYDNTEQIVFLSIQKKQLG